MPYASYNPVNGSGGGGVDFNYDPRTEFVDWHPFVPKTSWLDSNPSGDFAADSNVGGHSFGGGYAANTASANERQAIDTRQGVAIDWEQYIVPALIGLGVILLLKKK